MKTTLGFAGKMLILLLLATTAIQCSDHCNVKNTSYSTVPTYMSYERLRASVTTTAPQELLHAGKIYFKDNFLYVNEVAKGIHVIDNNDPKNPVHKSFINIPGNYDLTIIGNTLYADSYVDLVAIDISKVGQEHEVSRFNNAFGYYSNVAFAADPVLGIVTELTVTDKVVEIDDCNSVWQNGGIIYNGGAIYLTEDSYQTFSTSKTASFANVVGGSNNSTGIAGSMARFATRAGHLYALDGEKLIIMDVANAAAMTLTNKIQVSWDIETIFPQDDNLFIGSRSGMFIYDISNPVAPVQLSVFTHMKSCDPVVVEDGYAYVTLRDGTSCNGTVNQLEVIDIHNLTQPRLLKTFLLTNPHGLGIDNNVLFVCDGKDGLKIFDASNKDVITSNLKAHYGDMKAFDIIPFNNVAMMIAEDGLYQYDYSNLSDIKLLSKINIKQEEE